MISFIFSSLCAKGEPKKKQKKTWRTFTEAVGEQDKELAVSAVTDLLVGDLQQVQHHGVSPHVLQEPLLLHAALLTGITQLTEPKEDLNIRRTRLLFTYYKYSRKAVKITSQGFHLFDDIIVVCFVAVNLRFIISILYWAQNPLLTREINKKSLQLLHSKISFDPFQSALNTLIRDVATHWDFNKSPDIYLIHRFDPDVKWISWQSNQQRRMRLYIVVLVYRPIAASKREQQQQNGNSSLKNAPFSFKLEA